MGNKTRLKHDCALHLNVDQDILSKFIDTGMFIKWRRTLKRVFMVSRNHPDTQFYIRSNAAEKKEKLYHLVNNYWMIHLMSMCCLYRQILMFFVFCGYYMIIPVMIVLGSLNMNENVVITSFVYIVLQMIFQIEIIFHCFTGYFDQKTGRVILNQQQVFRHYLKTLFVYDVLSMVPFWIKVLNITVKSPKIHFYLWLLNLFKLARYSYWMKCYRLTMDYFNFPGMISTMIATALRFFFVFTWCSLMMHFFRIEIDQSFALQYGQTATIIMNFYEMVLMICLSSFGIVIRRDFIFFFNAVIFLNVGWLITLHFACNVWQFLRKYMSLEVNETVSFGQFEAYSSYMGLRPDIKERVQIFLDFKFQKEYYKEYVLMDMLSENLQREIQEIVSSARMEKVKMFNSIPDKLKVQLENCLTNNIFLPGDVIIRAGTTGDFMCFIVSGTVIVSGVRGKHICCLEDGANFGEIALILDEPRVTTVTSATPCEVLMLNRSDFESILQPYPSIIAELRKEALRRLGRSNEFQFEGPACNLFDPSQHNSRKTIIGIEHISNPESDPTNIDG